MYNKHKKFLIFFLFFILIINTVLYAQSNHIGIENGKNEENKTIKGEPITLMGETLFFVYDKVGSFSSKDRAKAISDRLSQIRKDRSVDLNDIVISDKLNYTEISIDDVIIMTVTNGDAQAVNMSRQALAKDYAQNIQNELISIREQTKIKNILVAIVLSLAITGILIIAIGLLYKLIGFFSSRVDWWRGTKIQSLKIQEFEIISANRIAIIIKSIARILYFVVLIITIYFYVPFILSLFPLTRGFAEKLVGYILSWLNSLWKVVVFYVPYIFITIIVILIAYYVLKLIRLLFREIEKGTIKPSGFNSDWAQPTYKLIRLSIIIIAIIIVLLNVFGIDSKMLKWGFIFLGCLIVLSSISSMSNFIAGIVIIYMNSFSIGDYIKVDDIMGKVIFRSLLVTRIRTDKNIEVTIPNSVMLKSHIFNFSCAIVHEKSFILNTTISIGYKVSWRKVHEILIESALLTRNILKEPSPFVLQKSLDKFHVNYELNAYTDKPDMMASIYSELHQNIQDKFNEAQIEIMTPNYTVFHQQ
ncbi:TPA: mechanosensitive ion channel [bacterium]|nr:mechanosensitive ion channel [bacterium]